MVGLETAGRSGRSHGYWPELQNTYYYLIYYNPPTVSIVNTPDQFKQYRTIGLKKDSEKWKAHLCF